MVTSAYSLPEAKERVEELQDTFALHEDDELSEGQVLDIAATLIRRADTLLAHLPINHGEEGHTLRVLTPTLRRTAFLLMRDVDADQARY